jgi:hypothetical protein
MGDKKIQDDFLLKKIKCKGLSTNAFIVDFVLLNLKIMVLIENEPNFELSVCGLLEHQTNPRKAWG